MSDVDQELLRKLEAMQEDWDKAPVGGYGDKLAGIEDGDYQARVESWEMFSGKKNPEDIFLKMFASIQHHAEHNGREIEFFFNVTDPERLGFLKDHFFNLGVTELDMTQLAPGSELLNALLDVPILIGVYTNKKGYRNVILRQRLDGEVHSDLGTAQQQIESFEQGTAPKTGMQTVGQQMTTTERTRQASSPEACICPNPSNGQFDDSCPVPGHGIAF